MTHALAAGVRWWRRARRVSFTLCATTQKTSKESLNVPSRPRLTYSRTDTDNALMWFRRYSAGALVLAVLLGGWAAPYSHLHRADAHLHSHFSAHQTTRAKDEPASPTFHESQEEVLSLTTFLFEASRLTAPVADLQMTPRRPEVSTVWRHVDAPASRAHAPPFLSFHPSRAPPPLPPPGF